MWREIKNVENSPKNFRGCGHKGEDIIVFTRKAGFDKMDINCRKKGIIMTRDEVLVILAGIIILAGIFLGWKGKPSMIRERFSSGVSPKNERKFMMTIGGGIAVLGADLMILGILPMAHPVSDEMSLIILAIGIVLFVAVILVGQKYYRR